MIDQRDVLSAAPPRFTSAEAEQLARQTCGLAGPVAHLDSERDQNFRIDDERRGRFLLKISNAAETEDVLGCETEALLHILVTDASLPVTRPCPVEGDHYWASVAGHDGQTHFVRLFTFLDGRHERPEALDGAALYAFGVTLARLGRALRGFWHPGAGRRLLWDERYASDLRPLLAHLDDGPRRAVATKALDGYQARALPLLGSLRAQVIHNDFSLDNTLLDDTKRVAGIVDFGDLVHTALMCDVSTALASLLAGRNDPLEVADALLAGYGSVTPFEPDEIAVLVDLLAARLVALVAIAAWRVEQFPDNTAYIMASVESAWAGLSWLDEHGFDSITKSFLQAAPLVRASTVSFALKRQSSTTDLLERRQSALGSALSPLSYEHPLRLVRAEGVWLFDAEGNAVLDAYNNVPVVGHCHPRVTEAIDTQARAVNTNLRYLHPNAIELAERLCASMPEGLDVCMFVNSGSEANDLAWRIATAATGGSGGIVTEHAYHGITEAIASLSPEEWVGDRRPDHVETILAPDGYAGRYRADEPDWAERYAAHIDDALAALTERDLRPAAVYVDSGFTSDGILDPPPEYLRELVRRTHDAGALFVADEVQAGFGRLGHCLWGFERFGVVPDLVTLGKPMGNGYPVAAVIARSDLVDKFAQTTEFFSTFGGNPVACAAGLAVLDVIEDEELVRSAAETGHELHAALDLVGARHDSIGEVRGSGLLLGVALVGDAATRSPDPRLAHRVMNGMRERGVLVGTTGPHRNVLKLRPPLAFRSEHVALVVRALDEALEEAGPQ